MEPAPNEQPHLRRIPTRRPFMTIVLACIVMLAIGYTLLRVA
jgi:hypothetical protein